MSPESDQNSSSGNRSGSEESNRWIAQIIPVCIQLLADMAACIRFFSRIPLARINSKDMPAASPDFSRIARALPLAGIAIAIPSAALGMLLNYTQLPALAIAALVAGSLALVTGALHEDGLSDVADGFFGGSTTEKRLQIMKDSRIGAFGALTLIVSSILRIALLAALWQRFTPAEGALLFLAAETLSRALLIWQWQTHPLARPEGLAARFGKPTASSLRQALFMTAILLVPAFLALSLQAFCLGVLISAGTAYLTGRVAVEKIGGMTGDVLGTIQQIAGLGFLTGILMVS